MDIDEYGKDVEHILEEHVTFVFLMTSDGVAADR